jgi:putative addiction module component (TIGR02574 family)
MSRVDDAFLAAESLNSEEKLKLISRIRESVPKADFRPSEADMELIRRRSAELDAGTVKTVSWEEVRDSVRARLANHE